jgi:glycosyltransferase involved in cell wall biosynthesis
MNAAKVTVILPTYNESTAISAIVSTIKERYPEFEVIVIDDGSSDDTAAEAKKAGADVYSHPYNIGNGAAVKSGIRVASGDVLVFMDGDGQHDPADIEKLLKYIPEFDMVVGARSIADQASLWRAFGNKIYSWFASYVAKFSIKDLTSGFRAIKLNVARNFLYLLPNTYSYPTTITLGVLRSGLSVKYVPIKTKKRKGGKSNIKIVHDGVRFSMRVFLPVSFLLFILGVANYLYTFITRSRFTNMSVFLFVAAIIIFMMSLISEQICQMRFERRSADRPIKKPEASENAPRHS